MRPVGLDARRLWLSYPELVRERIIEAFCEGARFQLQQMERDPKWKYVENFNREYARCRYNLSYSNTVSPIVHDEVEKLVPEVKAKEGEQRSFSDWVQRSML